MSNEYEEITTTFWKPEKGDQLEGKVVGEQETANGTAISIMKTDGQIILANYSALNDTLKELKDRDVRVTCTGEETSKLGRKYKTFKVEAKKE